MRPKLALLAEIFEFFSTREKRWLLPLILAMIVLGGLLIAAQASALAPFIYTLL